MTHRHTHTSLQNSAMPGPVRQAFSYKDQEVALLTQHGKERVIASVLDAAVGCRVKRVDGYDTDLLGTFTRDIPRAGTQLEAARTKARLGMKLSGLPLGLASEGAFGADPMIGLFPWNTEVLIWMDDMLGPNDRKYLAFRMMEYLAREAGATDPEPLLITTESTEAVTAAASRTPLPF